MLSAVRKVSYRGTYSAMEDDNTMLEIDKTEMFNENCVISHFCDTLYTDIYIVPTHKQEYICSYHLCQLFVVQRTG